VFANVMAGALRLLGVPADNLDSIPEARRENTLLQASDVSPVAPIIRDTAPRDAGRKLASKASVKVPVRVAGNKAQAQANAR
jgi:hypothetical protein